MSFTNQWDHCFTYLGAAAAGEGAGQTAGAGGSQEKTGWRATKTRAGSRGTS